MPKKIEISHRTIIFTVLFLLGLWFLFRIKDILIVLFISLVFMSALNPAVDRLEKYRLPRWVAIIICYLLIFGLLGAVLTFITSPLIKQTSLFVNMIAGYIGQLSAFGLEPNVLANQIASLSAIPANLFRFTLNLFSNLITFLALVVITFYLLLERKNLNKYLVVLFGSDQEKKAGEFVDKVEKRLGNWVRGEITLMTIIGIMTYIGLRLLGIEAALPLALLSALLEVIPNFGPILSAIPAILVGLTISPWMAVAVGALYFLVQQVENSLIVPKVMQKAVGVNPLVTLIALAIGFEIGGIGGAILSIPVVLVIQIVAVEFFSSKRFQNL